MAKEFVIDCGKCGAELEFDRYDLPELGDLIDEVKYDTRAEVEREFEGYVERDELIGDARLLFDLSAAIRRGDREEAEYQLDRLADELGTDAFEQVQQGRFSPRARWAA